MELETRWMKKTDLSEAMRIMKSCGLESTDKQFDRLISKASTVCVVAESEGAICGILTYDVGRVSKIKVISVCVDESARRKGVGSHLMSLVTSKLNGKRNKVEMVVSEYNLSAQLFLRALGFKAVSVLDNSPNPSEYKFLYKLEETSEAKA